MNLVLLGQKSSKSEPRRDGDLRKLLLVVEWLLLSDRLVQVYFDRSIPYAVSNDDRDLLSILTGQHNQIFKVVDGGQADQTLLLKAKSTGGVIVSGDSFRRRGPGNSWYDLHPWLNDHARKLYVKLEGSDISIGTEALLTLDDVNAFKIYRRMSSFLFAAKQAYGYR